MTDKAVLKPGENIRPVIDADKSKNLIMELYGLKCTTITELNGYDDKNFKVLVESGERSEDVCRDGYVFKIINTLDSKKTKFFDAQNELLFYLNTNGVTCPKPVKNINGSYYSIEKLESGEHVVRLLEFLSGSIFSQVPPSLKLFYQAGKYVATLDGLLKGFKHEGYDSYRSVWMLNSVPELNQFLFAITDPDKRKMIEDIINEFQKRVLPFFDTFEKGLIHGDFNEQNILVEKDANDEWSIKGILDFGDSHYSCYLYELAITLTYMMFIGKDIDAGGHVIAGYLTVKQITDEEFSLLKICVAARYCQSLVIGAYSSLQDPNNSYILTTAAVGWDLLTKLRSESEGKTLERWKNVADSYTK